MNAIGIIASSLSQGFDPMSLSPITWLDSRAADMASDGSQWTDRMATHNFTATGSERPTYSGTALNGRPGYIYDGSANIQTSPVMTEIQNAAKVSLWMVGKRCTFSQDDGSSANATNFIHYIDDNVYGVFSLSLSLNYGATSSSITNAFHYLLFVYDGTQATNANKLKVYVDGVQKTLTFVVTIPALTENNGSSVPHLGNFRGTYQAGTLCEMGVVNRTLSGTEITNLNSYLATKYAL